MFKTLILRTRAEKAVLRDPELEDEYFYFDREMVDQRTYVVVMEAHKVVGIISVVENSMWVENAVGVGFVETHADRRQRGIAKLLVDGLFQFAREQGKAISNSPYSPCGLQWLQPLMQVTAARYPDVRLHER